MNCHEFENIAGAVLEGESHPEAQAHLASCPHCRLLVDELGALEAAAHALPALNPADRLWERIQAAAVEEGLLTQPSWWRWTAPGWKESFLPARPAFAGALLVLVLLGAGLASYPELGEPVAEAIPDNPIEVAQGELIQEAGYAARYAAHLNNVEHRVLEEATPETAELRKLVAGPLDTVERAIEQTEQRLTSYPDDALARRELHRLYGEKVAVLQAMSDPIWYQASY
ncbi:MAG: hypothetical protein ACE5IP_06495 [Terriglobia bacterium]